MPSPKSGTAGSLVKPTAPTATKDADDSTGGSTQDATNSGSKTGGSPSSVQVKGGAGSAEDAESASPEHKAADHPDKTSWIELQLVYESNGLPVAGAAYKVTLPDGTTVASGSTDDKGVGRVDHIDPGSCQISFTKLDKEAWDDA